MAQQGLIDECRIMVNPIVLGRGRTIFEGIKVKLNLKLTMMWTIGNGNVPPCYAPQA